MPTLFESTVKSTKPASVKTIKGSSDHSFMGPLTCFAINPSGVRFETQEANETVILFLRQHIIVNLTWVLIAVILLFAPSIVFPLIFRSLPIALPPAYSIVSILGWYLATVGFIIGNFLHWFFNIYIVTNERIVDIDFYFLLFKRISQAELEKIQDISYSSGGIFATVFNYGNVTVQTAGEAPNLEFDMVPNPDRVVETIRSITEALPGAI